MKEILILALVAAGPVAAESLDDVLDRFYDARGGLHRLGAVESARISGTYLLTGMPEEPIRMEWKRPGKLRLEIGARGAQTVEAFDGETAWVILPGSGVAQELSGGQAHRIRRQADLIDGPLVDWKAKGNIVRDLGPGELDGVPVRKLGLVEPDGEEATIFLDSNSFLPIRRRGKENLQGVDTEVETFLEDYKKIGGLMIAHTIKIELSDVGLTQWFRIENLELNVRIPDERFALPPAPAAGGGASAGK